LYGHSEIENQLTTALKRDEEQQETEMHQLNANMEHVSNVRIFMKIKKKHLRDLYII
jgi:hypothetical protein